jgi:gephyrin
MLSVTEALDLVLAQAQPLTPVTVAASQALGLIAASDVQALDPLPSFPAAIKDGYAVVAADGPGNYPIIGETTAGHIADFTVIPGTVSYITTGAPLPPGADAVVMVEETALVDDSPNKGAVWIKKGAQPGQDVRPIGFDIAVGETVLRVGETLGPPELGLLASVGVTKLAVYPKPQVAILSTGDELAESDQPLQPGQIRDSNRPMLCAAISAVGGTPIDLGTVGDRGREIAVKIQSGLEQADILLTSGGVSMGNLDLIRPALANLGAIHFSRLRMKPGKPCTFATAIVNEKKKLIFGLPGNPVSSLVTFYLLAAPAIRRLAGWPAPNWPRIQATLAQPLKLDPERPEYHRVLLRWSPELNTGNGGWLAISTGNQASSRLLSARSADALLELPQAAATLPQGAVVDALILRLPLETDPPAPFFTR